MKSLFFVVALIMPLAVACSAQMPPGQVLQQMEAAQLRAQTPPAVAMTELNRRAAVAYGKKLHELRMDRDLTPQQKYNKALQLNRDFHNELFDNGDAYLESIGRPKNVRPPWCQPPTQGLLQRLFDK